MTNDVAKCISGDGSRTQKGVSPHSEVVAPMIQAISGGLV